LCGKSIFGRATKVTTAQISTPGGFPLATPFTRPGHTRGDASVSPLSCGMRKGILVPLAGILWTFADRLHVLSTLVKSDSLFELIPPPSHGLLCRISPGPFSQICRTYNLLSPAECAVQFMSTPACIYPNGLGAILFLEPPLAASPA